MRSTYVVALLFASLCYFLIPRLASFNILCIFVFLFCFFLFSVLCILCFCSVLCIVSPFVYTCPFPIFVQVYRPLPPGGNPVAVNKYQVLSYIFYIHATFSASLTVPEFIVLKACDVCTWRYLPICSFLQHPIANIIFFSNIFLNALFWKVLKSHTFGNMAP